MYVLCGGGYISWLPAVCGINWSRWLQRVGLVVYGGGGVALMCLPVVGSCVSLIICFTVLNDPHSC